MAVQLYWEPSKIEVWTGKYVRSERHFLKHGFAPRFYRGFQTMCGATSIKQSFLRRAEHRRVEAEGTSANERNWRIVQFGQNLKAKNFGKLGNLVGWTGVSR